MQYDTISATSRENMWYGPAAICPSVDLSSEVSFEKSIVEYSEWLFVLFVILYLNIHDMLSVNGKTIVLQWTCHNLLSFNIQQYASFFQIHDTNQ